MVSIKFKKNIPYLVIALFAFASCKKGHTPSPGSKSNVDIYVAGYITSSKGYPVAALWKNGAATKLADSSTNSQAYVVILNGDDVYVVGTVGNDAAYWKNGIVTKFGPYPWGSNILAVAINGTDVYMAGYTTTMNGHAVATYWKNNSPVKIATDTTFSTYAEAIATGGSDIYIAGRSYSDRADMASAPLFWKNGVVSTLPDLSKYYDNANSITIVNSDIYIVGSSVDTTHYPTYVSKAILWKNGALQVLPGGSSLSEAIAFAINGSNIYVCGETDNNAVYWTNGVSATLSTGTPLVPSMANTLVIFGSDIYISGTAGGQAVYWKNGIEVVLAKGAAAGIVVIAH